LEAGFGYKYNAEYLSASYFHPPSNQSQHQHSLYLSINKYHYRNPARNITTMSPEPSTFAPSLVDDSVKEGPCEDLGAASLVRPFTKKQQYEFNSVEESRAYGFRDR